MTKKKTIITLILLIAFSTFFLIFNNNCKCNHLNNEIESLKKAHNLKSDSLAMYKKYFDATLLYMEGSDEQANILIQSISESDSLVTNTFKLFNNKIINNVSKTLYSTNTREIIDTVIINNKNPNNDLEAVQAELDAAIFKLNELQMANGILDLVSSKGKKFQYIGQISNGEANGFGVGIFETGSVYKGFWKNNQRHGKGLFIWKDEEQYEGDFFEDRREGYGIYKWKNGEVYEGYWENDRRNGLGKLYSKSKRLKKEGFWKDDLFKKSEVN